MPDSSRPGNHVHAHNEAGYDSRVIGLVEGVVTPRAPLLTGT
ncbi:MAG: hypothetical protein Q6373_017900 [Candidatus Sigynarchaeota archaeon]